MRYSYEKYSPEVERKYLASLGRPTGELVFQDPGYLIFDSQQGMDADKAIAFCRNSFDANTIVAALNLTEERKPVNGR